MIEQYKKTFIATQAMILLLTGAVWLYGGNPPAAAAVFVATQIGALAGAWWGRGFAGVFSSVSWPCLCARAGDTRGRSEAEASAPAQAKGGR